MSQMAVPGPVSEPAGAEPHASKYHGAVPVEISIRAFGPINRGTISVAPLTLLIGPNNSGKSYTAAVVYAASGWPSPIRAVIHASRLRPLRRGYRSYANPDLLRSLDRYLAQLTEAKSLRFEEQPDEVRKQFAGRVENSLRGYGERLVSELERAFGSPLAELQHQPGGTGRQGLRISVRDPSR